MQMTVGEVAELVPQQHKASRRLMQHWIAQGILRPSTGGGEGREHFKLDLKEIQLAIIAAAFHGWGWPGLSIAHAVTQLRNIDRRSGSNFLDRAMQLAAEAEPQQFGVIIGLHLAARGDKGEPLFQISVHYDGLGEPFQDPHGITAEVQFIRLDWLFMRLAERLNAGGDDEEDHDA